MKKSVDNAINKMNVFIAVDKKHQSYIRLVLENLYADGELAGMERISKIQNTVWEK